MKSLVQTIVLAAFCVGLLSSGEAKAQMGYHQTRHIHVNETHLNAQQIQELDKTLGYTVPSGFYWLNGEKGIWGYQGNSEALGSIFRSNDPRRAATAQKQQPQQRQQKSGGSQRPYISNNTGTGSAVINPNKGGCSYVSAGGTTMRVCD